MYTWLTSIIKVICSVGLHVEIRILIVRVQKSPGCSITLVTSILFQFGVLTAIMDQLANPQIMCYIHDHFPFPRSAVD